MSNIFDALNGNNEAHAEAAQRQENDLREAMCLLMTRREGRLFLRRTLESTNDISHLRAVALMVMNYMEGTHV